MKTVLISTLSFIIVFFACLTTEAQELNCEVTIVAPDASKVKTDPKVFKTLEQAIREFMNNRKWTTDVFNEDERIECSIFIGITDQQGENGYSASLTVISKRPVFNSDYRTTVLNVIDNEFRFNYQEFQAIEFNENQFTSNLSHVLAYYAYLIIGSDYDTFSEKGGDKYLQKAVELTNIVSTDNAKVFKGWKSYESNQRNRYWIITNILNGRYEPYRTGMYTYYRKGLDNFYTDPDLAREQLLLGLTDLASVTQDNPNLAIMQMWSEAKSQEMIDIFSQSPPEELSSIIETLKLVDPINGDKYDDLGK